MTGSSTGDERFDHLRAFLYAMFDEDGVPDLEAFCTDSFRLHDGDATATRDELAANLRESGDVFDKRVEDVHGFGCDDWAAARLVRTYEQHGTHLGVEQYGTAARFTATLMARFDGESIDELWVDNDALGLLQRLDIVDLPAEDEPE
ncbi:ester cyclase [Halovivax cerinus]|uniref:Ester cyclase n=1 Tax=Halovivax cerinus TaxID=1487865 RepID=A0ABD5NS42_9EURY|nr:ester cyclase [Halovivax cerinus]